MPTAVGIEQTALWDELANVGVEASASWNEAAPSPAPPQPTVQLDDGRSGPFRNVWTDFSVTGVTRIFWDLRPQFRLPGPLAFRAQVGQTGNPLAEDWAYAGPEVTDTFMATDSTRRAYGKLLTAHYRVQLTDARGNVWVSPPATVLGQLNVREWAHVREMIRREQLRLKKFVGQEGLWLKRQRDGTPCPVCIDPDTGSVQDSHCPSCYGTRFLGGYFRPLPLQFVDTDDNATSELRDLKTNMKADVVVRGRMLATPMLTTNDVWVDVNSDLRYWVADVNTAGRVRGVPVVLDVTLAQFAMDHVIYDFPLE